MRFWLLIALFMSVAGCQADNGPTFRAAVPLQGEMLYELN
jgi:hypothetical protein